MVRQDHRERNQKDTVHPELVEGFVQSFPVHSKLLLMLQDARLIGRLFFAQQAALLQNHLPGYLRY
jgi:hypothetical protein